MALEPNNNNHKEEVASQPAPASQSPEELLKSVEAKRDEYLSGWQRAKADFSNYKKEEFKRLEEVARYGQEELVKECITILDNFDLGLRALEKAGAVERGIYLIRGQIEDVLKRQGLKRIEIKTGDMFNPMVAEALHDVESDLPPGSVVEEIAPGYELHDKIIRPARVTVSKPRSDPSTRSPEAT